MSLPSSPTMSATLALLQRHASIREGVYTHRGRTWHWFEQRQLRRLTLVRERHVSRDPADWPKVHAPPVDIPSRVPR